MTHSNTIWRVNKIVLTIAELRRRSWANNSDDIVYVVDKKEARQILIDTLGDRLNDAQDAVAKLTAKLAEAHSIDVS